MESDKYLASDAGRRSQSGSKETRKDICTLGTLFIGDRSTKGNRTKETHIEVVNNTESNTRVTCDDVEGYDYQGCDTPVSQFQDLEIKARKKINRRVEVNNKASNSPWRMTLRFTDGCVDQIKINQQCVFKDPSPANYRELQNCGHHEYDYTADTKKQILYVEIKDSESHLIQLLQTYLDKMKKLQQYKEAMLELQKKLNSKIAMQSAAYRAALQSAINDLKKDQEAYELLNEAKKLARAKEFGKALAKLKEAEMLAIDSDLQKEISDYTDHVLRQEQNAKAQDLMNQADELAKQKHLAEALQKYAEAQCYAQTNELMNQISEKARQCKVNMDNEHAKELQAQANMARYQGDFEGARAQYQQAAYYAADGKIRDSIKEDIEKSYNMEATSIKKQAGLLVSQGNTVEALKLFEKSLGYASCANDAKLINSVKEDMLVIGDAFGGKLRNEAMKEQNDFVRALDTLLEAKRYAKDVALTQLIENDIQTLYKKEAMRLQSEANNLVTQGKFEDGDQFFDKALLMVRDPETRQSILSDKMNALKKQTELTLDTGQKLASQKKYEAAQAKFSEAIASATDGADLMSIIKDKTETLDKQNEMLQKQTEEMIRLNQFNEGKTLLKQVMNHTMDSRQLSLIVKCKADIATNETVFLQSEANKCADQNKFKEANDVLNQAQAVAVNYEKTRSIDVDRAKLLNKEASYIVVEKIDFAEEDAETKLAEVEQLYLTAQRLHPTKELRKNLRALNYIIEGTKDLKEAMKLNNELRELLETAKAAKTFDFDAAQNKCRAAADLVARAEYSFNEGTKINNIFKDSVDTASEEKKVVNHFSDQFTSLRVQRNNSKLKEEKLNLAFEEKYLKEKDMEERREREAKAAVMEEKVAQSVLVIDSK